MSEREPAVSRVLDVPQAARRRASRPAHAGAALPARALLRARLRRSEVQPQRRAPQGAEGVDEDRALRLHLRVLLGDAVAHDVDDDDGDVVLAAVLQGGVHQLPGALRRGLGAGHDVVDLQVGQHADIFLGIEIKRIRHSKVQYIGIILIVTEWNLFLFVQDVKINKLENLLRNINCLDIDVGKVHLSGKYLGDLFFGNSSDLNEVFTEFLAFGFRRGQGFFQLLFIYKSVFIIKIYLFKLKQPMLPFKKYITTDDYITVLGKIPYKKLKKHAKKSKIIQ